MMDILNQVLILVGIVVLIAVAYCVVWAALFFPISKLRKHREEVAESERELKKIEYEIGKLKKINENIENKTKETLLLSAKADKDLEEKVELLERIKKLEQQSVSEEIPANN